MVDAAEDRGPDVRLGPGRSQLVLGASSRPRRSPTVIVGSTNSVARRRRRARGGLRVLGWSDGGAQAHIIIAPYAGDVSGGVRAAVRSDVVRFRRERCRRHGRNVEPGLQCHAEPGDRQHRDSELRHQRRDGNGGRRLWTGERDADVRAPARRHRRSRCRSAATRSTSQTRPSR